MFCLSFVVVTVKARLAGMDSSLEQAAMDLYANEWQTFWRVTFPLVFPGILGRGAAELLAVLRRLHHHQLQRRQDDRPSRCSSGASAQRGIPLQVNVVGTAMFLVSRSCSCSAAERTVVAGARARVRPRSSTPARCARRPTLAVAYWLDDPARPGAVARRLDGAETADLAVVGGGYTGLWTALRAKERTPASTSCCWRPATAAEQASGRNGGFAPPA